MTGNEPSGMVLQERDRHLLRELAIMRVIDREQTRRVAGFGSVTRANTRLLRLTQAGLLGRFFLGTTGGGKKAIYMLSPKGAKLIGVSAAGPRRQRDELVIADLFVAHQFLVNEIYCAFKYGVPAPAGAEFRRWLQFKAVVDPAIPLIPDGFVEVEGPTSAFAAFLEVDLGHERLSVWRGKVRNYLQYARSGKFNEQFRRNRFFVLVVTDSNGRQESLRRATAQLTPKIFRFATFESIKRSGLWAPIWFRPAGNEPQTLIETP
jgi:hypothetical protein